MGEVGTGAEEIISIYYDGELGFVDGFVVDTRVIGVDREALCNEEVGEGVVP